MDREELKKRTKEFAIRIIKFVAGLPYNKISEVLGKQLLKSGTSIGANYREAIRSESHNDFIHKIGIIQKEAEESQYWLELFESVNIGDPKERQWLFLECCELLAIFTATVKTAKQRRTK